MTGALLNSSKASLKWNHFEENNVIRSSLNRKAATVFKV